MSQTAKWTKCLPLISDVAYPPYGQDEFSVVLAVKDQIMKMSDSLVLNKYCIMSGCSIVLDHTVFRVNFKLFEDGSVYLPSERIAICTLYF